MKWIGSMPALIALILVLIAIVVLRLNDAISADAAELNLSNLSSAIIGGGAVAVGTKVAHNGGKSHGDQTVIHKHSHEGEARTETEEVITEG